MRRLYASCFGCCWAHLALLFFVFVIVIVDHDVMKVLDILKQRLEALIPIRCCLMQKRHALVDEAEMQERESDVSTRVQETLSGIRVVQAFGRVPMVLK